MSRDGRSTCFRLGEESLSFTSSQLPLLLLLLQEHLIGFVIGSSDRDSGRTRHGQVCPLQLLVVWMMITVVVVVVMD